MYNLATICFMCLTENKCLKTLYNNDIENDAARQIKYLLPEIMLSELKISVHMCCACHTALQNFHSFKTRCMDNYYRLKNYLNTVKPTPTNPIKEIPPLPPKENNNEKKAPAPEPEKNNDITMEIEDDPLLLLERREHINLIEDSMDMNIKEELFDSEESDEQDNCQPIQFIKCEMPDDEPTNSNLPNIPPIKDYECSICEEKFVRHRDFRDHMNKNHAATEEATDELILPGKSRKIYEKQYEDFIKWSEKKKVEKYTENVMLAYFFERSKLVKASTIWAQYSMLKAMLVVKNNIDISKYSKLLTFLRRKSDGYKPKKSKILTAEQVDQFLLEAPDNEYLLMKVALILGIAGACRGNELLNLSTNDVTDLGSSILFSINTRIRTDRTFIVENSQMNPVDYVKLCKKYSDSETDEVNRPRDVLESTDINSLKLLPEKSRKKYEAVYKTFMEWRSNKNIDSLSENVLLTYFLELSQKYVSSSLWAQYSMLRSTININNNVSIERYTKLRAFLKRKGQGYLGKKAKLFSPEEIKKFINEAPDNTYLAIKVAMIMGIMGQCHVRILHSLNIDNIEDLGTAMIVTVVPNTKTKIIRKFTITGHFYPICKKYADLRPSNLTTNSFFINYYNGKCTQQNIGINKFGGMGKQVAKYLKLPNPELYTGHSFRKSYAALILYTGGDINALRMPDTNHAPEEDNNSSLISLPEKSRRIYEKAYREFQMWGKSKKVEDYSESVLLAYFNQKATCCKASTLWSYYSMLKATMAIHNDIDIGKYTKLTAYLKRKNDGYKPQKSKILSREQIETFMLEAPDDTYLMMKVAVIFGIAGACRREELTQLIIDDIQYTGSALFVTIRESNRIFTVEESKGEPLNFLDIYRKYASLRDPKTSHRRFFVLYKNGRCFPQVVGKNSFGKIPKEIATYLKLPDAKLYTAHCFRSSSASLLADAAADIASVRFHAPRKAKVREIVTRF